MNKRQRCKLQKATICAHRYSYINSCKIKPEDYSPQRCFHCKAFSFNRNFLKEVRVLRAVAILEVKKRKNILKHDRRR